MQVKMTGDLGNGHMIEIGQATWDETKTSVRNRYPTSNGGFSPRSSSEIPMVDIVKIVEFIAENNCLTTNDCARMIEALAKSIQKTK